MLKYFTFLPILFLTLSTISPITIAQQKPETTITRSTAPTPKYTGVLKQVDDIAQQITVRIDTVDTDGKQANGSGVIIEKSGDTYSVVTAAHVFKDNKSSVIITPTQERIVLKAAQINILNKDLDIALVEFTSKQNYQAAELGNYQFQNLDWVFISGFPAKDVIRRRYLNIGAVVDREQTEFYVKDRGSLNKGYGLIYTNLSLPGMSGGAVLDRQGRLVGINTGAENIEIINQNNYQEEEINFGYALGIPVSTILGALSQRKIATAKLNVTNIIPSKLAQGDSKIIKENLLSELSAPNQTSTAKEWLDYGNLRWRSQEHHRAIIAFDRVISLLREGKTSSDKEQLKLAYFGKGLSLLSNQQDQEAVVAFRAAIATDSEFVQAWRYQGRSLNNLKRYMEALTSYQQAIKLAKNNFVLYVEQGNTFDNLKRYSEAIDSYSSAIQIQPNHPWVYNNRGLTYNALRQYSQAISDYSKAIELNPQSANGYYNRGNTYRDLKQYSQAIADANKAIELQPQDIDAYNSRGVIYQELKQYPQAIADYNKAIELNPQSASSYNNRGLTYQDLKQYSQAIADYNKAIEINPQSVNAYNNRGNVYKQLKQYPEAISDYNKAIKIDPQNARAYYNRGNIYQDLTQYPQAISDYNKAIELNPQSANTYNNRGLIYSRLEQYPQAIADYHKAIELNPQFAEAYGNRGFAYYKFKQPDKAKVDVKKAAQLFQQQDNQSGFQAAMEILKELGK